MDEVFTTGRSNHLYGRVHIPETEEDPGHYLYIFRSGEPLGIHFLEININNYC